MSLPTLSNAILPPSDAVERAALPERAVQFGTGALLRGLVDAAVDAANRRGRFNGRIVAIGSTGSGRDRAFATQDGLYTLVTRGLDHGAPRDERRVITSISRALSATDQWAEVLACARNPALRIVFSNTTEVGLTLDDADAFDAAPPRSFPAKLTRFLFEHAASTGFTTAYRVIVVPCELLERNGDRLRDLVQTLTDRWQLDARFGIWLRETVTFCNTLVDRIVPGAPQGDDAMALASALGYSDALLTVAEHFQQLVIEGDDALAAELGFIDADAGIMVVPDVEPYRQRKVGLLNGAHTLMVTTALLCGCETVLDAMRHPRVGLFIRRALLDDMLPTFDVPGAAAFAHAVLDRFSNPFIRHALIDITLHGTTKFRVRLIPTLQRAALQWGRVPESLAFGLAAHLWYLRGDHQAARRTAGLAVPADVAGERLHAIWSDGAHATDHHALDSAARRLLSDEATWGTDLTRLHGLTDDVTHHLHQMAQHGVDHALHDLQSMRVA